jgi:uncharacterized membrane protein
MPHIIEFRKRAHEVSRLEAFSDVIFGFAISLLVVSLEAPKSYEEMLVTLRGFLPFTICFFIFIMIWWEHHRFFKRYALQDATTIILNILLMFVVLFYVYPLKFMFSLVTGQLHGGRTSIPADGFRILFTVYGVGFTAVFWLLSAMYFHALKKRDKLHLNEVEQIDTRETMYDTFFMGLFGIASIVLAHSPWPWLAGPVFFLICVPKTIIPTIYGRKRRRAEERMLAGAAAPS